MYFCEKDVSVSIHNRNLHFHAIEMFKASKSMALPIIAEVFGEKNKNHYNLRHNSQYLLWYTFGISCNWQHLIPRSWNLNHLSVRLKQIYSLDAFILTMVGIGWKSDKCACRIFRAYIHNVGLLQEILNSFKKTNDQILNNFFSLYSSENWCKYTMFLLHI